MSDFNAIAAVTSVRTDETTAIPAATEDIVAHISPEEGTTATEEASNDVDIMAAWQPSDEVIELTAAEEDIVRWLIPDSDSDSDNAIDMVSAAHILSEPARDEADNNQVYQDNWIAQVFIRQAPNPNEAPVCNTVTEQRQMRALADTIFTPNEALRFKQAFDCVEDFYYHRMPTVRSYAEEGHGGNDETNTSLAWSPRRHQQACDRLHGPGRHACQLFISGRAVVCKVTGGMHEMAATIVD
jgi:hypothetical protein